MIEFIHFLSHTLFVCKVFQLYCIAYHFRFHFHYYLSIKLVLWTFGTAEYSNETMQSWLTWEMLIKPNIRQQQDKTSIRRNSLGSLWAFVVRFRDLVALFYFLFSFRLFGSISGWHNVRFGSGKQCLRDTNKICWLTNWMSLYGWCYCSLLDDTCRWPLNGGKGSCLRETWHGLHRNSWQTPKIYIQPIHGPSPEISSA